MNETLFNTRSRSASRGISLSWLQIQRIGNSGLRIHGFPSGQETGTFFLNIKKLLKLDFRMNWFSCKLAKYAVAGTICVLKASFRLPTAVLWNSAPWTAAGDSLFSLHLKPSLVCQQHHTARWFKPSVNSVLAPNLTGSKIMDLNILKNDTCLKTIQRITLCQSILVLGRTIEYNTISKLCLLFLGGRLYNQQQQQQQ